MKKKSRLYKIKSIQVINFMESNQVYPRYENWNYAYFEDTYQFRSLLESYAIQQAFKNKLK